MMVVLIPALEKSGDEAANLGKIVAACLKGMMGATLGSTVEGSWEEAIGTKQTRSPSSFMTVFDEVGYYTAQGMATMAAQARSLGFSLVFAAQDLPAMEKRVKQEARSILGNCNVKIFGKLEDPLDTKEFLDKHAGHEWVMETKGMTAPTNSVASLFSNDAYMDDRSIALNVRQRVSYDHLRKQREGQAYIFLNEQLVKARLFHAVAERPKAMRVHRMLPVPGTDKNVSAREKNIQEITQHLKDPDWLAETASPQLTAAPEITAMQLAYEQATQKNHGGLEAGALAVVSLLEMDAAQAREAERQQKEKLIAKATGQARVQISTSHPLRAGDEAKVTDVVAAGHFSIPGAGAGQGGAASVAPVVRAAVANQPVAQAAAINPITGQPAAMFAGQTAAGGDGGISQFAASYGTGVAVGSPLGSRAGDLAVVARKDIKIDAADLQLPPAIEAAAKQRGQALRQQLYGETEAAE
jgi:intracellular multiplication protein IcmO